MNNNGADILLIRQYLEGKLEPKQMHELEKQALNDPFLADALEGYAHAVKPVNSQLSILQRQLEERIARQQEEKNVFNFTWQRLSIAAAAGLMFISAGILFWMNLQKHHASAVNSKKNSTELRQSSPPDTNPGLSKVLSNPAHKNKTRMLPTGPPLLDFGKPKTASAARAKIPFVKPISKSATPTQNPRLVPGLSDVAIMGSKAQTPGDVSHGAASGQVEMKSILIAPVIRAKVISMLDGEPLAGVSIRIKEHNYITTTDAKGEFVLPDSLSGTLLASHKGYAMKEVKFKAGEKPVITLVADK